MAEQSRGLYRLTNSRELSDMERKLNFILEQIANRLDKIEGMRGYPKFYKTAFDFSNAITVGQVLRASSTSRASMATLDVDDVINAVPNISSGSTAQVDLERSLISLIDAENDYVVHQFPTQWLEYNCEVFQLTTHEAFEELDTIGGDVSGPASAIDSNIAEFNGITGKVIKDGAITHASVVAAGAHQVAEDAIDGIVEGDGAGNYSAVTNLSGDYLLDVYDNNSVIIHQYPLEWTGYNSDVFGLLGNGVNTPAWENWPYAQLSSSADQTVADTGVAYAITYDTQDVITKGITHSTSTNPSRVYIMVSGSYLVTFSAVGKSTAPNSVLDIWLAVGGVNVARSNTLSRFVGGGNERIITVTFIYEFYAGQYFELYYHGDNTGVKLEATAAAAAPDRPASPSIILTVNKINF